MKRFLACCILVVCALTSAFPSAASAAVPEGAACTVDTRVVPASHVELWANSTLKLNQAYAETLDEDKRNSLQYARNEVVGSAVLDEILRPHAAPFEPDEAAVARALGAVIAEWGGAVQFARLLEYTGTTEADHLQRARTGLRNQRFLTSLTKDVGVTEAEARRFYRRHPRVIAATRRAVVVSVRTLAAARRLMHVGKTAGAREMLTAARRSSGVFVLGSRAYWRGSRSNSPPGSIPPAAFTGSPGIPIGPLQFADGGRFHIVVPQGRIVPRRIVPFASVRKGLMRDMLEERRQRVVDAWVRQKEAVAVVECAAPYTWSPGAD